MVLNDARRSEFLDNLNKHESTLIVCGSWQRRDSNTKELGGGFFFVEFWPHSATRTNINTYSCTTLPLYRNVK
jgi:hypothetical protein